LSKDSFKPFAIITILGASGSLPGDKTMVSMKNVTTDPAFTIEKQCDRCKNILYFGETVISDIETDNTGRVVHSSIVCPICGNVIVLYSNKDHARENTLVKVIGAGGEA
jgi:hypothetical protein